MGAPVSYAAPAVTYAAPTVAAATPIAAANVGGVEVVGADMNMDGIPDALETPVIAAAPAVTYAAPTTYAAPVTYAAPTTYAAPFGTTSLLQSAPSMLTTAPVLQ